MERLIKLILVALAVLVATFPVTGCGGSGSDLIDLIENELDPPSRRQINQDKTGVNNFFVNSEFGSISVQASTMKDTLGISFVRVLFAWTTGVQPSPGASANYSFFDDILAAIPEGVDVLVVLAHTPNWMADPANWIDGNPRTTWVERWLKPTVSRYSGHPRIVGWEVWNEPDLLFVDSDVVLELADPVKYFEMLVAGSTAIRSMDPSKLVLNAATASIQQSFPDKLNYNKDLRDLGALDHVDVWNVHYYGEQFENVIRGGGVGDFLREVKASGKPIWLTESGEQGVNNQLAYVETAWPFLDDEVGIDRFYYFRYGSPEPAETTFGLFTTDPAFPISDLGVFLRDN